MKLKSKPDLHEEMQARREWHDYFAWIPVRVGPRESRWLETVERRGKGRSLKGTMVYEYRAK